jgi:hypothetical protein
MVPAAILTATAAIVLAACSSTSASSGSQTSGGGGSSAGAVSGQLTAARSATAEALKQPTSIPLTTPLKQAPARRRVHRPAASGVGK